MNGPESEGTFFCDGKKEDGGGGGGQFLKGKLECKGPPSIMLVDYVGSPEEI